MLALDVQSGCNPQLVKSVDGSSEGYRHAPVGQHIASVLALLPGEAQL